MTLIVDSTTTIADVQQEFAKHFPFLKIEFAARSHGFGEDVHGRWYHPSFLLQSIAKKWKEASLEIQPWHKTGDVEALFEQSLGLHVQIFRHDDGRWIQTAGTDLFTLNVQNETGRLHTNSGGFSLTENENLL